MPRFGSVAFHFLFIYLLSFYPLPAMSVVFLCRCAFALPILSLQFDTLTLSALQIDKVAFPSSVNSPVSYYWFQHVPAFYGFNSPKWSELLSKQLRQYIDCI